MFLIAAMGFVSLYPSYKLNVCSEFSPGSGGTFDWIPCFILTQNEEE